MRITKLKLKKLSNTRDLGGMPCAGGKIKSGLLFRSGKLYKLPEKTLRYFCSRGVKYVLDMRIDTEVGEYPDTLWSGAEYLRLPLTCTATPDITRDRRMRDTMMTEGARIKREFGDGDNYMMKTYDEILFSPQSAKTLKRFFIILRDADAPVIWHCSGGKDRAGLAAMLLEGILGVPDDVIIADFTASEKFQRRKRFFQKFALFIAPAKHSLKVILFAMMRAPEKYILHALEKIRADYGSVEGYALNALGLEQSDIAVIRDKYIEK